MATDEYTDDLRRFNEEVTPLLLKFKDQLARAFFNNKLIYQINWRGFCDRIGCIMDLSPENLLIVDEIKNMGSAGRFKRLCNEQCHTYKELCDLIDEKKPKLSNYI